MKTILLPYHDEDAGRSALDAAIMVARQFDSYLEGMIAISAPPLALGPGMALSPDYVALLDKEWRNFATTAREHFVAVIAEHGLPFSEKGLAGDGAAAGWREFEGREADVVGHVGRAFDLIVLGRTAATASGRWRETCEAALLESGRPVLVAPRSKAEHIGRTILVAWNGSTETARTIGLSMPFLRAAQRVVVASVSGSGVSGPEAEDVAGHLARHGIPVTSRQIPADNRPAGEAILDEAGEIGADLLIKGAFSRSRLRQIIFGGMTEHVIEFARLPLLMAH
jgi:nucleotide-binding universal stress UspA family protein